MPQDARDRYLDSLDHIEAAYGKIAALVGIGGALTFPDVHKLTEGLFLSSWTYWEAFLRDVLVRDLASDPNGAVLREIRHPRTRNAPFRLAEKVLNHPDHPNKFVDWDYAQVVSRADAYLAAGHRFAAPLPQRADIDRLKRIRNAIAHRSDRAWESFINLVSGPPFNLTANQRRGLTPGRFLYAHQWSGTNVMEHALASLRAAAQNLVP